MAYVYTTKTDHNNGYSGIYDNRSVFKEPRQKMWAVMRFEKHSSTDDAGWYIKKITNDRNELMLIAKEAIDFPSSDGQGWVSNINDIMIVEILPTDSFFKKV